MQSLVDQVQIAYSRKRMCCICETQQAAYAIKGIKKDCYCRQCANELFSDLDLLARI
ncbi:MAG: hypothetical protein HGA85_01690 [Nanoarchaeota archaeon]|nr:hypothetical protein [Nanoarchaeota archaeon]